MTNLPGEEGPRPHSSGWAGAVDGAAPLLAVAMLYHLLAILFTYPLVLETSRAVLGYEGFENTAQTLWLFEEWRAYVAASARHLAGWGFLDPHRLGAFFWNVLYFAPKVSMANGIDFVATWPLEAMFGFPTYYNVKCLLILTFNALAGYVLVHRLTASMPAAFLSGAILAFNPFTMYLLATGRVIECMLFWPALYVLCLHEAWHKPHRLFWTLAAAATLALATLTFWFYGHFLLAYTLLFLVYHLVTGYDKMVFSRVANCLIVLLAALVFTAPAAAPYLINAEQGIKLPGAVRLDDGALSRPQSGLVRQLVSFSCGLDYGFRGLQKGRKDWEPAWILPTLNTFSATLTVAGLIAIFLVPRQLRFWSVAFVVLYTLPLGPCLKTNGQLVTIGGQPIPLPYAWLVQWLPFMDRLFFPNLAMMLWVISVAVVIGLATARICSGYPALAWLLVAMLIATAAAEMRSRGQIPPPITPVHVPPLYAQQRQKPDATGFIYLPANLKFWEVTGFTNREFYVEPDLKHIDFHIAMHGRKTLWGRNQYLAGKDYWMFEPARAVTNSFLRFLLDVDRKVQAVRPADMRQVRDAGYHHVVVLERLCGHVPTRGDYANDPEMGGQRYEILCNRLQRLLGQAVYTGPDVSWDRGLEPDRPTLLEYRMAVFRIPGEMPR